MSEGWISLHRGWRDNPIFRGEFSRADAWIWLIENACWKPTRTRIKGEAVELQRGELSFAQRFMAEKWGWSKSRVDRFICDLREEGMIETRSKIGAIAGHNAGQGQAIIKICNYAKYQDVNSGQRGNDEAKIGATSGQQRGKEEQGNKETIEPLANASGRARAQNTQKPDDVSDQTWQDFEKHRRAKKAPITQTALAAFRREADRIGWTLEAALIETVARDWRGFKADWIENGRNLQRTAQAGGGLEAPSGRPMGRTEAAARAAAGMVGTGKPGGDHAGPSALPYHRRAIGYEP